MSTQTTPSPDTILVACPSCHSIVRTPGDRLDEQPKCPKCKAALLKGEVIELGALSFATHTGRGSLPVLVDFWAPWCGPCRMMAPILQRAAAAHATKVQFGKVNTDEVPELAARFNIRSIPTLILFRDGREIARQSGAVDFATLTRWLDGALTS